MYANADKVKPGQVDPLRLDQKVEVNAEVFVANGRLSESLGDTEKAMQNYAKALKKEPNNAEALGNIARIHFRQGNHKKAAEYFSKAVKAKPEDAGLRNDLGLTLSKLSKRDEAIRSLKLALELSPGTSRYANNLASVQYEAGDHDGAYEVLKSSNKPAVAHFNMAFLAQKHGHIVDAKKHLNEAIVVAKKADDSASKQAVERSKQMLAKLNGSTDPTTRIARADVAPKAGNDVKPASGNSTADKTEVKATSSIEVKDKVADPAAPPSGPFVMPPGLAP